MGLVNAKLVLKNPRRPKLQPLEVDASDDQLLERAHALCRVTSTQDIRFKSMAQEWQRPNRRFSGFLFGHQHGAAIGQYVSDLERIAKASEATEWVSFVEHLPY